jgi:hypothetical protein
MSDQTITTRPPAAAPRPRAAATDKPADLTARVAVYPSAIIKPIPPFIFSVPPGWVLDDAPDALVVARTSEQVDGFWVNAILSHDRVPRAVDFKQAAQATWSRLHQASPSAKVTMERLARFGSNVVYLRGAEMQAPKSGRLLAQLHALFFAPAPDEGKTVDFFQLIATSPQDRMEVFGPAFVELVGSFRFTPTA